MSVQILQKEHFIYLKYDRRNYADSHELRTHLLQLRNQLSDGKDLVIDLSACATVTSFELSLIKNLLDARGGSISDVRLILSPTLLEQKNLSESLSGDKVTIYKSRKDFTSWLATRKF